MSSLPNERSAVALARGVALRMVLGDRESHSTQEIARQRHQLGRVVAVQAMLLQWPPERRPRDEQGHAGLMHVKAAVADSRVAFLTSANLTEAALERNMELGVLIRGGHLPAAIRPPDRRAPEMWRNAGGLVLGCVHRNYQPHCVGPFNHPYSPVRSRRRDLQLQAGIETAYRCVENPAISKIIRSARLTRVALQLQPNAKPPESRALSKLGGRHRASGHAPEC